jgi:hypothetical protein
MALPFVEEVRKFFSNPSECVPLIVLAKEMMSLEPKKMSEIYDPNLFLKPIAPARYQSVGNCLSIHYQL